MRRSWALVIGLLGMPTMAATCADNFKVFMPRPFRFSQMAPEYQHYVYAIKDNLPEAVRHEVFRGAHVEIPQGMTRDNAAFSSFLSNEIVIDLKSQVPDRVERALRALPDYLNNAFRFPDTKGPGLRYYNGDIIRAELNRILQAQAQSDKVAIARQLLALWAIY